MEPAPLYVAVKGGLIASVGPIEEKDQWIDEHTKVYDLGDRVISPGFTDTHSFFTGYEFGFLGADLTKVKNLDEALAEIMQTNIRWKKSYLAMALTGQMSVVKILDQKR